MTFSHATINKYSAPHSNVIWAVAFNLFSSVIGAVNLTSAGQRIFPSEEDSEESVFSSTYLK